MSVQKFHGTINTDGIKDERGIETPSLSATGEVSGQTGVFTESVTAPSFAGDLMGTAAKATADAEGNVIPTTYATKEELAEETSARETAETNLSKGITDEATARAAAIEDIVDGTTVVGKATADGNGNNISSTYATQSALSSGLAGKANTSGTYSGLTVGNATTAGTATLADSIANEYTAIRPFASMKFKFMSVQIDNPAAITNPLGIIAIITVNNDVSQPFKFYGAQCCYTFGNSTYWYSVPVILNPASNTDSTCTLTLLTGQNAGLTWDGQVATTTFSTFGGAQMPSSIVLYGFFIDEA